MSITGEASVPSPLHERVAALSGVLSKSEYAVAQYLSDHPEEVASATAVDLAQATGTSNATVVRAIKSLGYAGLPELRRMLSKSLADRRDPSRVLGQRIDQMGGRPIALRVLEASSQLLTQQARTLNAESWHRAVEILDGAEVVYCYGAGGAGAIAQVFVAQHLMNGRRATAITSTGIGLATALLPLRKHDAIVLVAPLRYLREVELIVVRAAEIGAPVVLISEALGQALANRVAAVIATPQSTLGATSEILVPLVILDALTLEIAARHRDDAVAHYKQMNQMREAVVGAPIDVNAPPRANDAAARLQRADGPDAPSTDRASGAGDDG
jgi:DNA-binding MurR/RpiR family transcriptional regulator